METNIKKKILVIDDDVDTCSLLSRFLGKHGFEVTSAHTGKSALPMLRENKFHLILCDFRLGDFDGTEMLVEIKKIKDQRRASVYSQVLQSYIIFFVFLGIMLVIQNLLIPYLGKMSGANIAKGSIGTGQVISLATKVPIDYSSVLGFLTTFKIWLISLQGVFLMLALIQGLFAGLIMGKLSEGDMAAGLKHSLILMTFAILVMSFAQG